MAREAFLVESHFIIIGDVRMYCTVRVHVHVHVPELASLL